MLRKVFALSALAAAAVAQNSEALPDLPTLFNQTRGFGYLSTFLNEYPALNSALSQLTNVTVLAPSNAALRLFPWDPRYMELEASDANYVQNLIAYHILDGVHENLTDSWRPYKTSVRPDGGYTNVTGGQVVLSRWNWRGWVSEFTGGGDLTASAPIVLRFNGGIVYPINDLLNIPGNLTKEFTTGVYNGSSFVSALERAGLLEEVQSLKDVTVLVPDDAAFEAVGQSVSELSTEELAEILRYHIIPDTVAYSNLLTNGSTFTTLQGQDVSLYTGEEETFIQNAVISDNNILLSNGVAVLLDQVLSPQWTGQTPTAEQTEGVPALPTGAASSSTQGAASATSSTEAPAFTGAASSVKKGAMSVVALAGALAVAISL